MFYSINPQIIITANIWYVFKFHTVRGIRYLMDIHEYFDLFDECIGSFNNFQLPYLLIGQIK